MIALDYPTTHGNPVRPSPWTGMVNLPIYLGICMIVWIMTRQGYLRGDDDPVGAILERVHGLQVPSGAVITPAVHPYLVAMVEEHVPLVELRRRDEREVVRAEEAHRTGHPSTTSRTTGRAA